jgi:3-hydroxyisobutyrate dehydrogenase
MGLPLAQRLLASGAAVTVWNRTAAKAAPVAVQDGITGVVSVQGAIAPSVQAVLRAADTVVLMLSDYTALCETLLVPALQADLSGRLLIQMGTIAPNESRSLAQDLQALGATYIEAPVLGSIPEAKAGSLQIMVGAEPEAYTQALPLLKLFGPEPRFIGPVGTAMALKLALNQLIGSLTSSFALSLALVQREGMAVEDFMAILRQSALYAPTFDKKLQRMLDRNFDQPNFPTKHLLKDMRLVRQTVEPLGLDSSLLQGVEQILERAIAQGLAEADYSALYAVVDPG